MATLSQASLDVPGIIYPKLKNRFTISVLDSNGKEHVLSKALALQVIAISNFKEICDLGYKDRFGIEAGNNAETVAVLFEDDILNRCSEGLQYLKSSKSFQLQITYLGGNEEVLRKVTLMDCYITAIEYSGLDYASSLSDRQRMTVQTPRRMGNKIIDLQDHPVAAALLEVLNGLSLTYESDLPASKRDRGTSTREAIISYRWVKEE